MGENSEIEWTDHTFNPWIGCTNISPGCEHCYAEAIALRFGHAQWGNHPRNRTSEGTWRKPYQWSAKGKEFKSTHGRRQRVFCASMADVFDNQAPREWRHDLFALIRDCRRLDWLLLTKRPQNIRKMLPADWGDGYRNVWLGVTGENQEWFDRRWSILQRIPAAVRFISTSRQLVRCGCRDTALCRTGSYRAAKADPERGHWTRSGCATSLQTVAGEGSPPSTSSGGPIRATHWLLSKA